MSTSLKQAIENAKNKVLAAYEVIRNNGGTIIKENLENLPYSIQSLILAIERPCPTSVKFQDANAPYEVFNAQLLDWSRITILDDAFLYNSAIKFVNFPNIPNLTSFFQSFARCPNMVECDLSNITAENVTTCRGMFTASVNMTTLKNDFIFGKNRSLYQMFNMCSSLTTIDNMDKWDTSTVTDMRSMFSSCTMLMSIDLTSFECGNLVYFETEGMLYGCRVLTNLIGDKTLDDVRNGVVVMHNLVRSFDTRYSPLNFASMLAICKGVGTATSSVTLTLNRNAYNQLTEDEKSELDTAIAGKNWVIATA